MNLGLSAIGLLGFTSFIYTKVGDFSEVDVYKKMKQGKIHFLAPEESDEVRLG